jgi:hypothetical protein
MREYANFVLYLSKLKNVKSLYNKYFNGLFFRAKGNLKGDKMIEENRELFKKQIVLPNYSAYKEFFNFSPIRIGYAKDIEVFTVSLS